MKRYQYKLNLAEAGRIQPRQAALPGLALRQPFETDIDALAALMLDAYLGTIDDDGEGLEDARQEVAGYFYRPEFDPILPASYLAFLGEQLISAVLVSLWESAPLVSYVMTAAAYKNRGLVKFLLSRSLGCLQQHGHAEVFAVITSGNRPSESVFAAFGFERVDPQP